MPSRISIQIRNGTDLVTLWLPKLSYPVQGYEGEHLSLGFEATKGTGQRYVEEHFPGIPVEVLDTTTNHRPYRFSRAR